jgi:hypothetical protein
MSKWDLVVEIVILGDFAENGDNVVLVGVDVSTN